MPLLPLPLLQTLQLMLQRPLPPQRLRGMTQKSRKLQHRKPLTKPRPQPKPPCPPWRQRRRRKIKEPLTRRQPTSIQLRLLQLPPKLLCKLPKLTQSTQCRLLKKLTRLPKPQQRLSRTLPKQQPQLTQRKPLTQRKSLTQPQTPPHLLEICQDA